MTISVAGPDLPMARVRRSGKSPQAPRADRRKITIRAWIVLAVLGPVALFVAWRVFTLGMADLWVDSDPQTALWWRPADPEALADAADDAYSQLDFPLTKILAKKALATYPLNGSPYHDFAGIADFFGHKQEARKLFSIALQRSPRDMQAREALLEDALKDLDLPEALHQLDMELRLQPQNAADLVPALISLSRYPGIQEQLSVLLKSDPPWRLYYLTRLAADAQTAPEVIDRVFAGRGKDEPIPNGNGRTEADLLIDRQISDGRWGKAYLTWVGTLSATQRVMLGNVYDGGFTFQPSGRGFAWQFPEKGTGFDMLVAPRTALSSNNVLEVTFDGLPEDYYPIQQRLILGPGHYRLSGLVETSELTSEEGLHWTVACAQGDQEILGTTKPFIGDMKWGGFQSEFDVPESSPDCGSQWLRLDLDPGIFKGQLLLGGAIFDDLAIVRLGEAIPPPPPAPDPTKFKLPRGLSIIPLAPSQPASKPAPGQASTPKN